VAGGLVDAGTSTAVLMVGGLPSAAGGLLLLGLGRSVATASAGIVLLGIGISLPYPLFYEEGERVLADRPVKGLALLQVGINSTPIIAVPLFGSALASGDDELAFGVLAAFTVLTLALNAKPPVSLVNPPSADPG